MNLRTFLIGKNRAEFAATIGRHPVYLGLLVTHKRRPSPELAARISAATGGAVTVAELLYPDGLPHGAVAGPGETDCGCCSSHHPDDAA